MIGFDEFTAVRETFRNGMLHLCACTIPLALVLAPLTRVAMLVTSLFIPKKAEAKEKVTANELLRILSDRKDGVKLTDFESALIARILVMRKRGEFMTVDALLMALDEED